MIFNQYNKGRCELCNRKRLPRNKYCTVHTSHRTNYLTDEQIERLSLGLSTHSAEEHFA